MNANLRCLILLATAGWWSAYAQSTDTELARRLADPKARSFATSEILHSGAARIPELLRLAEAPPASVNRTELFIALADIFGELRTKEAIPFLIQNISLARWVRPNIWSKASQVVEGHLPAVGALIKIGPDACKALIEIDWNLKTWEDNLAAIFVVSQIGDPAGRPLLVTAIARANLERYQAEEGLKRLDNLQEKD
jgi:hypothetical protein